jgi:hypothetical protein
VVHSEQLAIRVALDQGLVDEAVERAEALLARCPDAPTAYRLLARASIAKGDLTAADLTLRKRLALHPDDCETRAWLAWLLITRDALEQARSTLNELATCPASDPEGRRWLLLRALLSHRGGDDGTAWSLLSKVGERAPLLPEDRALASEIRSLTRGGWSPPFQFAAELSGGGTSDALAGSPTDTPGHGVSSALARSNLSVRLRAPEHHGIAPFTEASLRTHGIAADGARGLSYADLGLRAGVGLSAGRVTSRLAYGHEELWVNLDGGFRFSIANRLEFDFSCPRVDAHVGFGRRDFEDQDRSRDEIDAAVIHSTRVGNKPALLAFGARSYRARRPTYHQLGATLTGVLAGINLGKDLSAELMAVTSWDYYPSSGGPDGQLVFGTDRKRRDLSGRLSLSLGKQVSRLAHIGVSYDFARRWSTADERFFYYPYTVHRGMIELRLFSSVNLWQRRVRVAPGHVEIPYDIAASREDAARVYETLRPDEDFTSGCGDVCEAP